MQLYSIEPSAFSARMSAREKVTLRVDANSLAQRSPPPQSYRVMDHVAVIDITGVMLASPDPLDLFLGGFTNTRTVTREIELASVDNAVTAILLRIDSPGGSVDSLSELGDAVRAAAQRKRVTAQVQDLAASAAYYAIAGASEVVAGRMDMVGSIGTILVVYDASEAAKSAGLRVVPIVSGRFKATAAFGTPLTGDEEKYLQGIVDAYFADFRRTVMAGRGRFVGPAEWSEVSGGQIFVASDALRLGLVDRLGRMADTMARLHADSQRTQARAQRTYLRILDMKVPRRRMCGRERAQRAELQLMDLRR